MEFSVVIPTYGRPDSLVHCLEALSRQDFPATQFEIIVVDDCSPVPVEPALTAFHAALPLRYHRLPKNLGPAEARNRGAALARGRFIAFLDDDCWPVPGWLSHLFQELAAPDSPAVGGDITNPSTDNGYSKASHILSYEIYSLYTANPAAIRFLSTGNLAVPADGFRRLGGFCTFLRAYEDRDFCDRWLEQDGRLAFAPEAAVVHHRPMSFAGFWKQHYHYGRSAALYYRRKPVLAGRLTRFLPGIFWMQLRRVAAREGLAGAARFGVLLVLSQCASLCGFVRQRLPLREASAGLSYRR